MNDRFDMALALIEKAKANEYNFDHGQPYENALLTGVVSLELKVSIKEIFDHLRSALDYCAKEVVVSYTPDRVSKKVYFPIVAKDFKQENFRSRVGQLLPGLLINRADLIPIFESYQPFSSADNFWLADLATLCNENKHENLSVSAIAESPTVIGIDKNGNHYNHTFRQDGVTPFPRITFALLKNFPQGAKGKYESVYLEFTDIEEEVNSFVNVCVNGVENIVRELQRAL